MSLCKIKMPDLGEGMTECEIVEWEVKVGQTVKEDDVLAGVMTDKAVVEIPSPVDGVIKELHGEVGELIPVGTVIVVLDVADSPRSSNTQTPKETAAKPEPEPVKAVEPVLPPVLTTETPPEVTVTQAKANPTPEPSTDKLTTITHDKSDVASHPISTQLSAPAVKQRAKSLGIDLSLLAGTGPEGRVLHQDIDQHLLSQQDTSNLHVNSNQQALVTSAQNEQLVTPQRVGPKVLEDAGIIDTTPIIGLRRKIGERMQDAKQRIPHITYVEAIDVTELEALRAHLNQQKRDDQEKLSLLPLLFRAITLATRLYPVMNSHFDDVNGKLHQYQALHLGIATQTDRGLLVPVLRHADQMDIWETAVGIKRLAEMARQGTLAKDELSGSTLTCSSLGKLGGLVSTPVINSPEVCIIGVNKIQTQPVYREGGFVPRKIMNLSSSFDHRIVDGYEAAQFIQCLREHLEHPATLFIE